MDSRPVNPPTSCRRIQWGNSFSNEFRMSWGAGPQFLIRTFQRSCQKSTILNPYEIPWFIGEIQNMSHLFEPAKGRELTTWQVQKEIQVVHLKDLQVNMSHHSIDLLTKLAVRGCQAAWCLSFSYPREVRSNLGDTIHAPKWAMLWLDSWHSHISASTSCAATPSVTSSYHQLESKTVSIKD